MSADPPTDVVDRCRACGGPGLDGDGVRCGACGGAWISARSLLDLIADATVQPLGRLPWVDRTRPTTRPCETCAAPMRTVSLYRVALDRCDTHGVWLDPDELELVLRQAQKLSTRFDPGGAAPWTTARTEAIGDALLGDPTSADRTRHDGLVGALGKLLG